MRISAKGNYALAAIVSMAQNTSNSGNITVISISEKLNISKIYLEQVFSLLKRGGIVSSVKGAQGGYVLTRMPQKITVFDVLSTVETALIESTENDTNSKTMDIYDTIRKLVYYKLDETIKTELEKITIDDLVQELEKHKANNGYMYII